MMANVEGNNFFEDLGNFKSKKCIKIMGKKVCDLNFTKGKIAILEKDLKKLCKK